MTTRIPLAIVGAGLMGHGIAQVFACAGHEVSVYDPSAGALDTLRSRIAANLRQLGDDPAAVERVHPFRDLADCVAGACYVLETALEDLAFKQNLLVEIERLAPLDAIFASNTSVIPITRIMEKLTRRDRALGTHWWNPPYLVPLVEVVGTEWTSTATLDTTIDLHRAAGKTTVLVKQDVPGFIGNRLQHALWREAVSLVEHGICDAETVDTVVKASFGRRLGVLGPLENADLVGTDLTLAIHRTVLPAIDNRPAPSPYLEQLVADGRLGMKSGEGFRRWDDQSAEALRNRVADVLRKTRDQV
jgi:3-hydroxybutyryl-CoA dehydrogenase